MGIFLAGGLPVPAQHARGWKQRPRLGLHLLTAQPIGADLMALTVRANLQHFACIAAAVAAQIR